MSTVKRTASYDRSNANDRSAKAARLLSSSKPIPKQPTLATQPPNQSIQSIHQARYSSNQANQSNRLLSSSMPIAQQAISAVYPSNRTTHTNQVSKYGGAASSSLMPPSMSTTSYEWLDKLENENRKAGLVNTPNNTKPNPQAGTKTSPHYLCVGSTGGAWTIDEDKRLEAIVKEFDAKNWKKIASIGFNDTRSDVQCLHRWQKVLKPGLIKGKWTAEEDLIITKIIETYGATAIRWSEVALTLPGRLGKQCRERWVNHLDPTIKKSPWTDEEDRILNEQHALLGNKWRDIAVVLVGRSENSVKNRWNSGVRGYKRRIRRETMQGERRQAAEAAYARSHEAIAKNRIEWQRHCDEEKEKKKKKKARM